MVMEKKGIQQKTKKKVKAVSAKDLNPDGTLKVKTTQELKAENDARVVAKAQKLKAEKDKATAKRNEEAAAREAAVLKKRAAEAANEDPTVETVSETTGPQTIATVVAKQMGMPGAEKLKPKEVLEKAIAAMPEVKLEEGLPKAQLLQFCAVLAVSVKAKREKSDTERAAKAAAKKARDDIKAVEVEAAKKAKKEALAAKAAERAAEKEAAIGMEPEPMSEEAAEKQSIRTAKKIASDKKRGPKLTKEQKDIQKRMEGTSKLIAAETKAIADEMESAAKGAAMARIEGGGGQVLGPIDTGSFTLPNPGGGPDLLERAQLLLVPGKKYGLIGRNGKGKSTLLKAMAARRIGNFPKLMSLHYVSQTSSEMGEKDVATAAEVVLRADVERGMLVETIKKVEALGDKATNEETEEGNRAYERMEEIGGDAASGRVDALLKNLGFSEELLARSVKDLSGGWRVRVALASALFAQPDMLLLDEPTNHLSIEAVLWLANEIATNPVWDNAIIITVSHDRAFLDATCTDNLHISGVARKLTQERGNYSTWMKRRVAKKKALDAKTAARQMDMDHLKEFIGRGGTYSNVSIQRKMKEEQLAKLQEEAAAEAFSLADLQDDQELPLTIHCGGKLSQPPIMVSDVTFGYPGMKKPLFRHAELCVDSGSKMVLLGENGRGKTTLVKLMLGELDPTAGMVHRNSGAKIALVNQHHGDQIDLDMTALDYLCSEYKGAISREVVEQMRGHLNSCGVDADLQIVKARAMSGGQRSRVAMAAVSYCRPHVIILDEPTNNLDVESVEALADSIQKFEGGVVIVSHDEYFVSRVANETWVIDEGRIEKWDFQEYIKAAHKNVKN